MIKKGDTVRHIRDGDIGKVLDFEGDDLVVEWRNGDLEYWELATAEEEWEVISDD